MHKYLSRETQTRVPVDMQQYGQLCTREDISHADAPSWACAQARSRSSRAGLHCARLATCCFKVTRREPRGPGPEGVWAAPLLCSPCRSLVSRLPPPRSSPSTLEVIDTHGQRGASAGSRFCTSSLGGTWELGAWCPEGSVARLGPHSKA